MRLLMMIVVTWYSLSRRAVAASFHNNTKVSVRLRSVGAFAKLATKSKNRTCSKIRPASLAFLRGGVGSRSFSTASSEEDVTAYDFDYFVIGAGSGGIASARRAASYGAKVAVVEKDNLGGTCVNVGCVPKKVMWNAASIAETLHQMHHYGFFNEAHAISFDWGFLKNSRDKYIQRLNTIYDRNLQNSGVTKLLGTASLGGEADSVILTEKDGAIKTFKAKHILIATGGYPLLPPGKGIQEHAIDSDRFFELEELPRKAVVVGAGYIAVELAGVLQALGADTKLVVRKESALRNFDEMLRTTLDEEMQRQGIEIFRHTNGVDKIEKSEETGKKTVYLKNGEIIADVDVVLMAPGRAPLVEPLDLPARGVKQMLGGYIVTNEYSETNVEGIYALGDVCGKVELTPMAIAAGRR